MGSLHWLAPATGRRRRELTLLIAARDRHIVFTRSARMCPPSWGRCGGKEAASLFTRAACLLAPALSISVAQRGQQKSAKQTTPVVGVLPPPERAN